MNARDILEHFVKRKRKMGWTSAGEHWWSGTNYKVPECTMSAWYKEARNTWNLSAHYDVFRDCVENEIYYDKAAWQRERKNYWYYKQQGGAFRKAKHHKKKVLSEEDKRKREWRKKVKDPRDQGSRFYNESGWTTLQRDSNKSLRRRGRAQMKSTNWEAYGKTEWLGENQMIPCYPENAWDNYVNPLRRDFLDPWDYY